MRSIRQSRVWPTSRSRGLKTRLSAEEQTAFAQIAVFRGGGTRPALQMVTGASLRTLHTLVGKALLRYDPEQERYAVHELLRQYAQERLAADRVGLLGVQERHAAYYLGALAAREAELKGMGQREVLDAISKDIGNIGVAWGWAAEVGRLDLLSGAVRSLNLAYEWLGRTEEGLAAMRRAAEMAEDSVRADLLALLLAGQARFTFLRGDLPAAHALLMQALSALDSGSVAGKAVDAARAQVLLQVAQYVENLEYTIVHDACTRSFTLFEACGDQWGAATALSTLSWIVIWLRPDYEEARRLLEQSVARYRAVGDQVGLSESLTALSMTARYLGDVAESLAIGREAYALAQVIGNLRLIAQAASNLGAALFWCNANEEAYNVLHTALAITLELGHETELGTIYFRLGVATMYLGRYVEAREIFEHGLAADQRIGYAQAGFSSSLVGLSWLALAEGDDQEALRLAEETTAHSVSLGEEWFRLDALAMTVLAARRMGDVVRARACAVAMLRLGLSTRSTMRDRLWGVGLLLADGAAPERAAALDALVERANPLHNVWAEDIALHELRARIASQPAEVVATARARWAYHDYWAALTELLAELEMEGWGGE